MCLPRFLTRFRKKNITNVSKFHLSRLICIILNWPYHVIHSSVTACMHFLVANLSTELSRLGSQNRVSPLKFIHHTVTATSALRLRHLTPAQNARTSASTRNSEPTEMSTRPSVLEAHPQPGSGGWHGCPSSAPRSSSLRNSSSLSESTH